MLVSYQPPYPVEEIRRALRTWAFSDRLRGAAESPADLAAVVRWLQTATVPVSELGRHGTGAARCRALLDLGHADTPGNGQPVTPGSGTPYTTPVDASCAGCRGVLPLSYRH